MTTRQQTEDVQDVASCEKSGCCSTSDDGSPMCETPIKTASVDTSCGCASTTIVSPSRDCNSAAASGIEVRQILSDPVKKKGWINIEGCKQTWQKIRGGVMFAMACITSPCCTPLLVPLVQHFQS